ncbi:MAG: imidazole glycerol phosphate synthase subunit HisH [Nitrospirae bacterium]|nr:imidazole glycerol phosphate synthase subunit HisH [Nitrospirota bacterium]
MSIVIIDYGLGNLRSVAAAVEKLGIKPVVSSELEHIEAASKLILPGVGAFENGIKNLRDLGLIEPLTKMVIKGGKPILGICLGFQLMARESFEFGHYKGLGWLDASVRILETNDIKLHVPHVGWDDLIQIKESLLFDGIPSDALFYYVHSFYVDCMEDSIVVGQCEYGVCFPAVIHKNNIHATQFHPEKSQFYGLALLKNFIEKA